MIWAIRSYGPGISIAPILVMAGLGLLVLSVGVLISRGIYISFGSEWRDWQVERERPSTELPRARIVPR